MKLKRLNHAAQNICQIFCGWRLNPSLQRIAELGSGVLDIDVLSGRCIFNGNPVESLRIAEEIRAWFLEDLSKSGISVSNIHLASLQIELQLSRVLWNPGGEKFFEDGREVMTAEMNMCQMQCTSIIAMHGKRYKGEHNSGRRWPINWSAA